MRLARGVLASGPKTWFFVTADYAFGHDLEKQASEEVLASGGKIIGSVRHPLGASDFSSFLLQAQASGADVVALANAGGDTTNSVKQAAEFKIGGKQKIVALIFDLQSVPALGLNTAQGLIAVNAFYWDTNDQTLANGPNVSRNGMRKKMMPNHVHAGVYAAVLHYLKAVDKVGSPADGAAVVAAMKAMPTDDPLFGQGIYRADGRKIHPMYLLEVKTPAELKGEWDAFKIVQTIPADKAFNIRRMKGSSPSAGQERSVAQAGSWRHDRLHVQDEPANVVQGPYRTTAVIACCRTAWQRGRAETQSAAEAQCTR